MAEDNTPQQQAADDLAALTEEMGLYGSAEPPLAQPLPPGQSAPVAQEQPQAPDGACPFCGLESCGHHAGGPA